MSKMSKHERAIRDRMERLEDSIDEMVGRRDYYQTQLDGTLQEKVLLQGLLNDAEEIGSTPAAEEEEDPPDGFLGRTQDTGEPVWAVPGLPKRLKNVRTVKVDLAPSGEPGLGVAGESETGGVEQVG